jgi:hypothetical protein
MTDLSFLLEGVVLLVVTFLFRMFYLVFDVAELPMTSGLMITVSLCVSLVIIVVLFLVVKAKKVKKFI